ncbi:hypothetical protein JK364_47310 [Streptomyces sp. 110]|uniref:Uncharacterized protein n=1 Tax=Streptomyces endocoffeicus TaxID=2898945 RepID=A0ABS1Q7D6_9ACTN|nr:hypothetical protein [Streptomyces endocoffeicus]MBL1119861.1 hypothetical protein [Streptomyces endocoffeicus]
MALNQDREQDQGSAMPCREMLGHHVGGVCRHQAECGQPVGGVVGWRGGGAVPDDEDAADRRYAVDGEGQQFGVDGLCRIDQGPATAAQDAVQDLADRGPAVDFLFVGEFLLLLVLLGEIACDGELDVLVAPVPDALAGTDRGRLGHARLLGQLGHRAAHDRFAPTNGGAAGRTLRSTRTRPRRPASATSTWLRGTQTGW